MAVRNISSKLKGMSTTLNEGCHTERLFELFASNGSSDESYAMTWQLSSGVGHL